MYDKHPPVFCGRVFFLSLVKICRSGNNIGAADLIDPFINPRQHYDIPAFFNRSRGLCQVVFRAVSLPLGTAYRRLGQEHINHDGIQSAEKVALYAHRF